MKLRNYFFGALACLALASCSSDDDAIDSGQDQKGDAYVAVKLVMPGSTTRAEWATDNYASGTDAENKVTDINFFLFDNSGNQIQAPISYSGENLPTMTPDNSTGTIEELSDILILLKDGVAPAKIAVVINWPYTTSPDQSTTLTQLVAMHGAELKKHTSGTFVLSNSVYLDNSGNPVYATPVTANNIIYASSDTEIESQAETKAVKIPVERVVARIDVDYQKEGGAIKLSDNSETLDIIYYNSDTETTLEDVKVTSYITGWWLHNTTSDTYLEKNLGTKSSYTWTGSNTTTLDPWFNDPTDYRSYWANIPSTVTWQSYEYGAAAIENMYSLENTSQDNPTYFMVAARLVRDDGTKKLVDLVQWMGKNFLSADDFKTYIAKYLGNLGYSASADGNTALTKTNFKFIYNDKAHYTGSDKYNDYNWQSRMGLASGSLYKGGVAIADADAELKSLIGIFKYYNNGQTYYFKKITHEPAYTESTYGIIRNHLYKLKITGITGLGTPVPNENDKDESDPTDPIPPTDPTPTPTDPTTPDFPEDPTDPSPTPETPDQPITPETPKDDHSAIAAQIMILKYRVVEQNIGLDNK